MTKIVVVGAGIGGVPAAYELKELLGKKADITVVSDHDYFQFVPSNPWVAVKWRKPEEIKIHLPNVFGKLGINFYSCGRCQAGRITRRRLIICIFAEVECMEEAESAARREETW